jgi:enterochelin esterase-like enzyme
VIQENSRAAAMGTALALGASVAMWALANDSLTAWFVGLGMDQERGLLLAACLEVAAGAGLAAGVVGITGAVRAGAIAAMVAIQIGPFLVRAAQVSPTPGLTAHVDIGGWLLQPVGMLLLGAVAATVGAAVGLVLRWDAVQAWAVLRRNRAALVPAAAVLALVVVATGAATTALQAGPISPLYQYGSTPVTQSPAPHTTSPVVASSGRVRDGKAGISLADQQRPGRLERLELGGHHVNVYLPGAYAAARDHRFAVVYFLHGFPGGPEQWVQGAQLVGVLDHLIASAQVPPLIAVLPDGNGRILGDSEWGNTVKGDGIETWLVDQLVQQIDHQYRTLGARYRGVAGLSAGGFGALNLAARHPEVFRWAASYSGYVLGRADLFSAQAASNSPLLGLPLLPAAQRMAIFVGAGAHDGRYLAETQLLASSLQRAHWSQLRTSTVSGGHGWEAWRQLAVQSLQWLGRLWQLS